MPASGQVLRSWILNGGGDGDGAHLSLKSGSSSPVLVVSSVRGDARFKGLFLGNVCKVFSWLQAVPGVKMERLNQYDS